MDWVDAKFPLKKMILIIAGVSVGLSLIAGLVIGKSIDTLIGVFVGMLLMLALILIPTIIYVNGKYSAWVARNGTAISIKGETIPAFQVVGGELWADNGQQMTMIVKTSTGKQTRILTQHWMYPAKRALLESLYTLVQHSAWDEGEPQPHYTKMMGGRTVFPLTKPEALQYLYQVLVNTP
jgi:hypothetical protein